VRVNTELVRERRDRPPGKGEKSCLLFAVSLFLAAPAAVLLAPGSADAVLTYQIF
jgi:hypothetical protein